jgi:hypothetical protein
MILNQGRLAGCLVDELLEVVHRYDDTLYMSTVIGVLELVKQQLIMESMEQEDDDEPDYNEPYPKP